MGIDVDGALAEAVRLGTDEGSAAGQLSDSDATRAYHLFVQDSEEFDEEYGPRDILSGEWAGESVPELFGLAVGEEWPDEETLDAFEAHYRTAYWAAFFKHLFDSVQELLASDLAHLASGENPRTVL